MEAIAEVEAVTRGTPKLNAALAKAQLVMKPAKHNSTNPHFKSTYSDLAAVIEACRVPLAENELAWSQSFRGGVKEVTVTTTLLHSSGEYRVSEPCSWPVPAPTAQALASSITYGRRYSLSAMLGIATEDDDGNEATAAGKMPPPAGVEALRKSVAAPKPSRLTIRDEEAPPHNDEDAERFAGLEEAAGPVRTHEDMSFPFGKNKGVKLSAMDAGSLDFYESAFTNNLADMSKAQWHAKTSLQLAAVQAEKRFRGL